MMLIPKIDFKDISLTQEIQFDLPDLDQSAIPHYLNRAARRMCQVGKMLRRTVEIKTFDCVENYEVIPPDCVEIVACQSVRNIKGYSCGEVLRLIGSASKCFRCGTRSWMSASNVINFYPARHDHIYEVEVAVAPLPDACEIDAEFVNRHYDTLILGARAYLYDLDAKPWNATTRGRDKVFAQDLRMRFERSIRAAAADAFMDNQAGVLYGPGRRIM